MKPAQIKPSHFKGNYCMGSVFNKSEYETIFHNMIVIQERLGDTWGITLRQYISERKKDGNYSTLEGRYAIEVLPYMRSPQKAQTFSHGLSERYFQLIEGSNE